ncbi:hypothetical protein HMSSN036_28490 [Paenibacillus macerans]|nr:hypothetical protein HMSSN036_28490 [Paenibacillus macerans]
MPLNRNQVFADKSGFSPGQLKIADFIERHPDEVLFMTEQEIADRIGTSIATVSRFWRAAGYENGKEFRLKLRSAAESTTPAVKLEKTISQMDPASLPLQMLEQSLVHLRETAEQTDPEELKLAASLMAGARRITCTHRAGAGFGGPAVLPLVPVRHVGADDGGQRA